MSQFHPEVAFGGGPPSHYDEDMETNRPQHHHHQQNSQISISQEFIKVDKPSFVWTYIHKLKTPQLNKRQKTCYYVCVQCIQENVPWQDCLINLVKQNPSNGTLHIKNRHPALWNEHVDSQASVEKKEKIKIDLVNPTRKRARSFNSSDSIEIPRESNIPTQSLVPKQYADDISNAEREKLELHRLDIQLRYDIDKQRLDLERRRDERAEREFELNQRLRIAQAKEAEFNLKASRLRFKFEMAKLGVPHNEVVPVLDDELAL